MNEGTAETPRGDIAQMAREHYERVSMASADWFSVIPQAIGCWEREPELLETVERLRKALGHILGISHVLFHSKDSMLHEHPEAHETLTGTGCGICRLFREAHAVLEGGA